MKHTEHHRFKACDFKFDNMCISWFSDGLRRSVPFDRSEYYLSRKLAVIASAFGYYMPPSNVDDLISYITKQQGDRTITLIIGQNARGERVDDIIAAISSSGELFEV